MGARRFVLAVTVALAALCSGAVCAPSQDAAKPPVQTPIDQSTSQDSPSSSSNPVHEKTGPDSSRTIHHIRVAEEDEQLPELKQAEILIQKHDNAAAEPLLQRAVVREPANFEAWYDLGFVENSLGKVEESIAAYRKSVASKPDVFESNLNLGLQLAKTGQPEAEQFLRAATQLKPTSHVAEGQYRAWLSLGQVIETSKPDEAIAAFRKAADLQPKETEPHVAAGHIMEMQKHYSEAEEEYKKALALDPASDALTGLANAYMQARSFPEAEECLRKLVQVHPEDAAAHIQLGRVLAAQGKNDGAVAELQAGLKIAPGDISAQRDLAETYVAAGKMAEAESAYRALIAAHPQDAELHRALGQALLHEKKFPEAQREFLTTVKLKPDFGEAYGDLAFAASENKDYALTLKALDVHVKSLPETPLTYFLRASALDHLRDLKKAAVNYHLFLKVAGGKYPDQEWQAKHRLIAIEPKK
ncbi:MAG TPA: tetratricopeptide repeat protein [Candidatus Sulfotelmatobacter sp.]